jgi:hypothetical protein
VQHVGKYCFDLSPEWDDLFVAVRADATQNHSIGRFAHQVVMSNEDSRKEEDENEVDKNMAGTVALLCQ